MLCMNVFIYKHGLQATGRQLGHSERLKEMREKAALHERQLALIHAHNQQLEQQRDGEEQMP